LINRRSLKKTDLRVKKAPPQKIRKSLSPRSDEWRRGEEDVWKKRANPKAKQNHADRGKGGWFAASKHAGERSRPGGAQYQVKEEDRAQKRTIITSDYVSN